jgi:DNA helicase HerA-like ATPase
MDYTAEEKLGTVLMLAVANFAKNFSQLDNSIKKIIVMDEAWALIKTKQGEDLFERLARTGRSLNTSCIFIGHSSKDLTTEGIRNAIRYKFVFNLGNREEALTTLEFLGMDVTEDNIELISADERGLKNGECLFSDVFGRVGKLKFDVVYNHLLDTFRTTPPERRNSN